MADPETSESKKFFNKLAFLDCTLEQLQREGLTVKKNPLASQIPDINLEDVTVYRVTCIIYPYGHTGGVVLDVALVFMSNETGNLYVNKENNPTAKIKEHMDKRARARMQASWEMYLEISRPGGGF